MSKAVAIGVSAGGVEALASVLPHIRSSTEASFFVVIHLSSDSDFTLTRYLRKKCNVRISEACDNEEIRPGTVYFSPPGYHLLIEKDFTMKLSTDEKVNFSRPSIDVLFESAAEAYASDLTGILLTGASKDGSLGLKRISDFGGKTIVQDPADAFSPDMPASALKLFKPDMILTLKEIAEYLETRF